MRQQHGDADIAVVGPALAEIFTTTVGTAAERAGFDDDIRDELADTFESYVNYLAAAQQYDPHAAWSQATALTAVDAPAEVVVGRSITFQAEHNDLLRDDEVARVLSGLLADGRA